MDTDSFEFILKKISHRITKNDTVMRKAIPADERLALTLRFLATGILYVCVCVYACVMVESSALNSYYFFTVVRSVVSSTIQKKN